MLDDELLVNVACRRNRRFHPRALNTCPFSLPGGVILSVHGDGFPLADAGVPAGLMTAGLAVVGLGYGEPTLVGGGVRPYAYLSGVAVGAMSLCPTTPHDNRRHRCPPKRTSIA